MNDHPRSDRGHPTYPPAAAEWLVGADQKSVLVVGACSGSLTGQLVALGHDVLATDPSAEGLERLAEDLPGLRTAVASAEHLPGLDGSVDVVVREQPLRDVGTESSLTEAARVLRAGGHLAVVTASQDTKIPWVRRLAALLGHEPVADGPPDELVRSDRFGFVDTTTYRFWQDVNSDTLADLVLVQPAVASLDHAAQQRKLAEVVAFYDDYGRGMDGMQLPWVAHCAKAAVIEHPWSVPPREGAEEPAAETAPARNGEDPPDDSVLIDFR
jgi:SAM-dependent methyltransferase